MDSNDKEKANNDQCDTMESKQENKTEPTKDQMNIDSTNVILNKLNQFRRNYNFAMNYSFGIINILKFFNGLLCDRVFASLYESKNFIKFFKEVSNLYQTIADQMKKQTSYVKEQSTVPKIMDDCLKQMIENTQNALCNNYLSLSNSLKGRIISEGLITNMDGQYNKLENLKKEIMKRISKIESRRKKLEKIYKSKYEILFEELVPSDPSKMKSHDQHKMFMLEDIPDFIVVELELGTKVNKMYHKTNSFLTDLKDLSKNMNDLFINYSKTLREALMIYVQECKKIYTNEMENVFTQAEIYCEGMSNPDNEHHFQIHKIFSLPEDIEIMNEHLKSYQHILKVLGNNKTGNVDICNDAQFEIQSYVNVEEFYEMLIKINPKGDVDISYDKLVSDVFKVKRDPGMFKGWRNAVLIFSKQNHVVVYDEPISYKTFVMSIDLSKAVCKSKQDKKNMNLFEITGKGKKINFGGSVYDANSKENLEEIMERIQGGKEQGGSEKVNKVLNLFKKKDKEKDEEKDVDKDKEKE